MKACISILLVFILGTFITLPTNTNPSFEDTHAIDVQQSGVPSAPSVIDAQFTNALYEEIEETLSENSSWSYDGEVGYPIFPTHIESILDINLEPAKRPPEQA
tara:strand:+ start:1706 stop:2014 length:309 start_codon:yes stop_codon:yes gene_type:complete